MIRPSLAMSTAPGQARTVEDTAWPSNDELVYGKWSKGECAAFLYNLKSDVARLLAADF